MMRRFVLFSLILGCMLMASSCEKETKLDAKTATTIDYLKKDYEKVVKKYPGAKGFLIEAQYELSGKVAETELANLKPVKVTYVFQWVGEDAVSNLLTMERDFVTGKTSKINVDRATSPWEDAKLGNFEGVISLEKALEQLKASEFSVHTAFATLRTPVIPNATLRYMFGDDVYVDAKTGEVFGPQIL